MKHWHIQLACHLLLAVAITAAFGSALQVYFPEISSHALAGHAIAATGTGWLILMLMARFSQRLWQAYWLGLGKIMSIGVLILTPSVLLIPLDFSPYWLPCLNVSISFFTMLLLNIRLNKSLQNSTKWNIYWVLCLGISAASWIGFSWLFLSRQ